MPDYEVEPIPVSSVLLNPKNYRHRPVTSQDECFLALFSEPKDRDYMLNLATDIATRGLDPSSLPIVQPEGARWRVLEGNRRMAALKAMTNPDVIPELPGASDRQMKAYRGRWAKLGGVAPIPRTVDCVVTSDVEASDHWITMKHTNVGFHKGAGTIEWDAEGKARHEAGGATGDGRVAGRRASSEQSGRAVDLLDALRQQFADDDEMLALVDRAFKKGITTLGRVLIRPENRLRLGMQIDGRSVRWTVSDNALRAAMHRLLSDLGTPELNSRSINVADDVVGYLDAIASDLPTSDDRVEAAHPAVGAPVGASERSTRSRRRKAPQPARRPYGSLQLTHGSGKTRAVLAEMKTLAYKDYAYTCAILNRVLLDLYSFDVLDALGKKTGGGCNARVQRCLHLLDPHNTKPTDRRFPHIWDALASGTGELSVDSMHFFVHRHDYRAHPDIARTQCEAHEPFLRALDDLVEDTLRGS